MTTGKSTDGGFIPNSPSMDDLMRRMRGEGGLTGWDALNEETAAAKELENARRSADEELKRAYVRFAATLDGQKILEDLLDQTLRRGTCHPDQLNATIEQEALYGRERKGNNNAIIYILKMIHDGKKLPAPGKKSGGKKSK